MAEPGHVYYVKGQKIVFKSNAINGTDQLQHDGILCQDLLRVLIDRVNYLNEQNPSEENIRILNNLRESVVLFETRALRRKLEKHPYPEKISTSSDGHIFKVNK